MSRTLTFHVSDVFITLSDRDVEALLAELDGSQDSSAAITPSPRPP